MYSGKIPSLSNKKLLELYFSEWGRMTQKGFIKPMTIDSGTTDCTFALINLTGRESARKIIKKMHEDFLSGRIDAFGKELKSPSNRMTIFRDLLRVEVVRASNLLWREIVRRAFIKRGEGIFLFIDLFPSYVLSFEEREYPIDVVWLKDGKVISVGEKIEPIGKTDDFELLREKLAYAGTEEAKIRSAADSLLVLGSGEVDRLKINVGTQVCSPD